jgi:hypothetical protein
VTRTLTEVTPLLGQGDEVVTTLMED